MSKQSAKTTGPLPPATDESTPPTADSPAAPPPSNEPLGINAPGEQPPQQPPSTPPPTTGAQEPAVNPPAPKEARPKRQQAAARSDKPECPYCKCACESNRSEPYFTRYYCPNKGCNYSVKVPRPNMQQRLAADRAAEQGGFSAR
jgi:hypothetical protein